MLRELGGVAQIAIDGVGRVMANRRVGKAIP
jgi:hypothetical protein